MIYSLHFEALLDSLNIIMKISSRARFFTILSFNLVSLVKCNLLHVVLQHLLGGVEGDVLASLAPPVHLSGERLGWTLLICVASDFRRQHLEVSWRSASEGHVSSLPYSINVNRKHHGHSAVAVITVATSDWPSYGCSVSHRRRPKPHTTSSGRPVAAHEGG